VAIGDRFDVHGNMMAMNDQIINAKIPHLHGYR
jgi:hypothetical protein